MERHLKPEPAVELSSIPEDNAEEARAVQAGRDQAARGEFVSADEVWRAIERELQS